MFFSLDNYSSIDQKLAVFSDKEKLQIATIYTCSGYKGEPRNVILEVLERLFYLSETKSKVKKIVFSFFDTLEGEGLLHSFEYRQTKYYHTVDLESFVWGVIYIKKHAPHGSFIEKLSDTFPPYEHSFGRSVYKPENSVRDLMLGNSQLSEIIFMNIFQNKAGHFDYITTLLLGVFSVYKAGFDKGEWLNEIPEKRLHEMVEYFLADFFDAKVDIQLFRNAITFLPSNAHVIYNFELLDFILRGDVDTALQKITSHHLDKKYLGLGHFIRKDNGKALPNFLEAIGVKDLIKDAKKKSSKSWQFLSNSLEFIFSAIILKEIPDATSLNRNRYNSALAKKLLINKELLHAQLDLESVFKNKNSLDCYYDKYDLRFKIIEFLEEPNLLNPFSHAYLVWLYIQVFGKEFKLSDHLINPVGGRALKLYRSGFLWYASILAEAFQLAKKFEFDSDIDLEYLMDEDILQLKDILEVSEVEEWEQVLKKIEGLAENFKETNKKKKTTKSESRLLWVVADHRLYVQPMEQTKLKSGIWSKPKKISDRRMLSRSIKGMLDIDNEIFDKAVKAYGRGYFDYDVLEVWKLLPNHPNVVLESDDNVSVIVEKRPLELQITEKGENYKLFFDKDVNIDFPLKRETPTRVILYDVDSNIKSWARNFPTDVIIPKNGKEKLKQVVSSLGQSLIVHSHVEDIKEELPELVADKTLHALLTPRGNNILLELYMKPFKTQPPYVVPGKGKEILVEEVDRERTRVTRQLKEEQEVLHKFYAQRPQLDMTNDGHHAWELTDREETLNALNELQFGDIQPVIEWPKGIRFKLLGKVTGGNVTVNIQSKKRDWFAIGGDVKLNEEVVTSLADLMRQFKNDPNSKYVEIKKDEFIALTDELRRQLTALTSVAIDDDKELRVHRLASYGVLNELTKEALVRSDDTWKNLQEKIEEANQKSFSIPTTLQADLRDYQEEGFQWLSRLASWGGGACLADDMGLGKTIQGLSLMLSKASEGPCLVVAPTSVTFNWVNEARKFAPTFKVHLLSQATKREKVIKEAGPHDLVICSYGLLQSNNKKLIDKDWNIVLLDEAQAIKNKGTKRSKIAMQLQANTRIITTGTPIENNLAELWNLFEFINPGLLGNWESFNKNFVLKISESGEEHHARSAKKVLRRLISPFILRRKKSEVLDELPQKTEQVLTVNFSDDEMTLYEAHRRTALEEIEGIIKKNENKDTTLQVLAELTKLRQLCCHPRLIDHTWTVQGNKVKLLLETVHELKEGGHRALIFSQFVGFLHIIKDALDKEGISYQYLDGSTTLSNRKKGIEAFQNGEGDVFLISLKAGGTGLNLTAADYVIHMDPWWNPAVEDQATDRAHRIGQTRPVTVYRMITKDSIEEKMIALHADKRELADDLLSGTSKASKLNTQELLKLLQNNEVLLDV
ncbi:DEAD/DEAH box helicase [Flammeovirga sp. SubArs3]|uniref:DEAD/DEAH box helicase n=1 Tax=Flammeovirga sp. SubArs3 TaxID=2995316 RepID=UPI00248A949C|nr:DEAD/DEAH box helicase [Flammeovirga sp. SubArs3]